MSAAGTFRNWRPGEPLIRRLCFSVRLSGMPSPVTTRRWRFYLPLSLSLFALGLAYETKAGRLARSANTSRDVGSGSELRAAAAQFIGVGSLGAS